MSTLDRRSGESIVDHVQRLLVDPLLVGASDAEIARFAHVTPQRVRDIVDELSLRKLAVEMHAGLVRPDGETPLEWLRGVLLTAAWAHCEKGRCRHDVCARRRAREAAAARRPTHETRPAFTGARPVDQSRGAPGTRNPGGAAARSIVPRA